MFPFSKNASRSPTERTVDPREITFAAAGNVRGSDPVLMSIDRPNDMPGAGYIVQAYVTSDSARVELLKYPNGNFRIAYKGTFDERKSAGVAWIQSMIVGYDSYVLTIDRPTPPEAANTQSILGQPHNANSPLDPVHTIGEPTWWALTEGKLQHHTGARPLRVTSDVAEARYSDGDPGMSVARITTDVTELLGIIADLSAAVGHSNPGVATIVAKVYQQIGVQLHNLLKPETLYLSSPGYSD